MSQKIQSQNLRIWIGLAVIVVLMGAVLGLEYLRGQNELPSGGQITLTPGSVPIYLDGELVAAFAPDALETLEQVSFVDVEEGKTQEGYLLRGVLLTYLAEKNFRAETHIIVASSVSGKSAELTWAEVEEAENMVLFDLSSRGTLKLVSLLEQLDTRNEWVQDVDRIEVVSR
jgi:hypothetical protein